MKASGVFRRFLCLLLVSLLIVPAALADVPDIASLSDDEIIELLGKVNQEVVSRGLSKTAKLPQGTYNAGKDVPAGRYVFTCRATGSEWGNVTIYSEGGKGKQLLWEVMVAPNEGEEPESIYITLNEGDQLKSGVPFSLTIMSGIVFQ